MCGHERHKSKVAASCNDSGVSPPPRRLFRMTLAANSSPVMVFRHRLTAANLPLYHKKKKKQKNIIKIKIIINKANFN